jgi:hypothetical protein
MVLYRRISQKKLEKNYYDREDRDQANISGKDHVQKITKNMGNKSFLCDAKILKC